MKTVQLWQAFFILAFILAQVSPACAFVSGKKSLLEICAADGSFKTIEVDAVFNPLDAPPPPKKQDAKNDCAFCFSNSNLVKIPMESLEISMPVPSNYRVSSSGTIVPETLKSFHSQPRAPPVHS